MKDVVKQPLVLTTSATRAEIDWACHRAGYYHAVYGGVGIESTKPVLERELGRVYHEALARVHKWQPEHGPYDEEMRKISAGVRLDARQLAWNIRGDATIAEDIGQIAGGLVLAYASKVWPRVLQDWEVLAVETEVRYYIPHSTVVFRSIPDLLLKRRNSLEGKYIETKTTAWADARWTQQWTKKVQVHAGLWAAQVAYPGVDFQSCEVWGLYKGDERDGRVNSPFSYGWMKEGRAGITAAQYSPTFLRGWERFPVSQYPGGLREWIDHVEAIPGLLSKQFPQTPPLFVDRDLVAAFLRQQAIRWEEAVHSGDEWALDRWWPQNFSSCEPARGHPCQFREICWLASVKKDPIGSGHFRLREAR